MAVKKEGVTYDEIVRSVRAGNFAPVYYLMGEEAYYIDKVSAVSYTHLTLPTKRIV